MLGADAVFCDGLLGAMLFSDRGIGEASISRPTETNNRATPSARASAS